MYVSSTEARIIFRLVIQIYSLKLRIREKICYADKAKNFFLRNCSFFSCRFRFNFFSSRFDYIYLVCTSPLLTTRENFIIIGMLGVCYSFEAREKVNHVFFGSLIMFSLRLSFASLLYALAHLFRVMTKSAKKLASSLRFWRNDDDVMEKKFFFINIFEESSASLPRNIRNYFLLLTQRRNFFLL